MVPSHRFLAAMPFLRFAFALLLIAVTTAGFTHAKLLNAAQPTADTDELPLIQAATQQLVNQSAVTRNASRIALIVGNGNYQSFFWKALPNTHNDVREIARVLQSAGFTLIGGGPQLDLDKASMDQEIASLKENTHRGGVSVFYFAGHGVQIDGVNYLVPIGASDRPEKLVRFKENALDSLENHEASLKIMILDACRDEMVKRGYADHPQGLARTPEPAMPAGTLIVYSTAPDHISYDGNNSLSPFAQSLVREMVKPGVNIEDMFKAVARDVSRLTENQQIPWISFSGSSTPFSFFPEGTVRPASSSSVMATTSPAVLRNRNAPSQLMSQADSAHVARNYTLEKTLLLKAANQGIAGAMFQLGHEFDIGDGEPHDMKQALYWYEKGAAAGSADAMIGLGAYYNIGAYVPRDPGKAAQLFYRAAQAGAPQGFDNLGAMYSDGLGVPRDRAQGEYWYKKAADQGYASGMGNLSQSFWQDGRYAESLSWAALGAQRGDRVALNTLGNLYFFGNGVARDFGRAMQYYLAGAARGGAQSMASVGRMYSAGQGVALDDATAMHWYLKAANAGDTFSMDALAVNYAVGRGVPKDCLQSKYWLTQAVDHGRNDGAQIIARGRFCAVPTSMY